MKKWIKRALKLLLTGFIVGTAAVTWYINDYYPGTKTAELPIN